MNQKIDLNKNEFENKVNIWIKESLANFNYEPQFIFWDSRFNIPGYKNNIIVSKVEDINSY